MTESVMIGLIQFVFLKPLKLTINFAFFSHYFVRVFPAQFTAIRKVKLVDEVVILQSTDWATLS